MTRQMTERETRWKDEAPPSTAMRNKKNIKRKKKLNTPKPSVFALQLRRGGVPSVLTPLSLQLVSLLCSSCPSQSNVLPFLLNELEPSANTAVWGDTQTGCMVLRCCPKIQSAEPKHTSWQRQVQLQLHCPPTQREKQRGEMQTWVPLLDFHSQGGYSKEWLLQQLSEKTLP